MNLETQQSELVLLNQMSREEFAKILVELIKDSREVQKDVLNLVFSYPNIVRQI